MFFRAKIYPQDIWQNLVFTSAGNCVTIPIDGGFPAKPIPRKGTIALTFEVKSPHIPPQPTPRQGPKNAENAHRYGVRFLSVCQKSQNYKSFEDVGAIIDRPPKNIVFRISRRKINLFSPCGDGFCLSKIHGRSMIAPTGTFFTRWTAPGGGSSLLPVSLD